MPHPSHDPPPLAHILLVEDELAHAELIRRAFEAEPQFKIEVAQDVREAQVALASGTPDLVIADLNLPDGRGTDLLPDHKAAREYPLVVMTSHGDEKIAVAALRAGALNYIVKSPATLASMPKLAEVVMREWREIAGRKRAEQALRKSEERFRSLIESSHDMIQSVAPDGTFLFVSNAWLTILGYQEDELVDLTFTDVLHDDFKKRWSAALKQVTAGDMAVHLEGSLVNKSGARVLVEGTVVGRKIEGELVAVHCFFRDIGARKRLQEQLLERTRLAAVGATAGKMAHELANRLNNVNLYTQMLQRRIAKIPELATGRFGAGIETTLKELDRITDLLHEFRALSRGQQLKLSTTDLSEVVDELLTKLSDKADGAGISIKICLAGDLRKVLGDRNKLLQVLTNLTQNALEAMPDGGTLTVRGQNSGDDQISLQVVDTGSGVTGEMDVFEPFNTTKPDRSGLGLSIARQVVSAHGGNLSFGTEPGGGTRFELILPLRPRL